jgi:hypothetical protein
MLAPRRTTSHYVNGSKLIRQSSASLGGQRSGGCRFDCADASHAVWRGADEYLPAVPRRRNVWPLAQGVLVRLVWRPVNRALDPIWQLGFGIADRIAEKSDVSEVCPAEVGAFKMRPADVGAFKMRSAEEGVFEMRPAEKGAFEMGAVKVGIFEMFTAEASVFKMRLTEVGAFEMRFAEDGVFEMRAIRTSALRSSGTARPGPKTFSRRRRMGMARLSFGCAEGRRLGRGHANTRGNF